MSLLTPPPLPLRAQAALRDRWLAERLATIMPALLAREGVDLWIVVCREYHEDPVVLSLLPAGELSARRRTILAFGRNPDGSAAAISLGRYAPAGYLQRWDPATMRQAEAVRALVAERNPQQIAINLSADFAFADGLSATDHEWLAAALGPEFFARCQPNQRLAVGWLERRLPAELVAYPQLIAYGNQVIKRAFSRHVITPGTTTTDDLAWWMRQTLEDHGLRAWFQPTISLQAHGLPFDTEGARSVIMPGDLLHCDVGFYYLGLTSDQQQHAYVLREGEHEAPHGLRAALAVGNRFQDLTMAAMQVGRSGNEVLAHALAAAKAEGIAATLYSHPIGYHGHAAGPTIGLWDQQGGVPGSGDYPLFDQTCYSIELNVRCAVPEWSDQIVRIALEEDAMINGGICAWIQGRQTNLHLV